MADSADSPRTYSSHAIIISSFSICFSFAAVLHQSWLTEHFLSQLVIQPDSSDFIPAFVEVFQEQTSTEENHRLNAALLRRRRTVKTLNNSEFKEFGIATCDLPTLKHVILGLLTGELSALQACSLRIYAHPRCK
jgi:hypothetical protein